MIYCSVNYTGPKLRELLLGHYLSQNIARHLYSQYFFEVPHTFFMANKYASNDYLVIKQDPDFISRREKKIRCAKMSDIKTMQLYNHCERFMAELADRGLSDNFTQAQIWNGILKLLFHSSYLVKIMQN